jgi:hypothetical protein
VIYLITFAGYRCYLHGSELGSVDAAAAERELMDQAPYNLDQIRRDVVLEAIQEGCAPRGWSLLAARV